MMFPVLITSLVTFPFFSIFYCILWLMKKMVFLYVEGKYKNRVEHLNSGDMLFTVGQPYHNMVNVIVIVDMKSKKTEMYKEMKEDVERLVFGNPEKFVRLLCTYHITFGYPYFLRDKVTTEDLMHVVDVENSTYQSIEDIAADYNNKPLPMNNKLLWQILVIQAPEKWKKTNNLGSNEVPIIFRLSHILGDGIALMNFGLNILGEKEKKFHDKTLRATEKKSEGETVLKLLQDAFLFFMTPGALILDYLVSKLKSGEKMVTYNSYVTLKVEKEGDCILERIKRMKTFNGDTTFTEVLLVAIAASFRQYYQKKKIPIPDSMKMLILRAGQNKSFNENGSPKLGNRFSFFTLKLPLSIESESLLDRLTALKKNTKPLTKGFELKLRNFIGNKVMLIFPISVIRKFIIFKNVCGYLTNLPELSKMLIMDGEVKNVFFTSVQRDHLLHAINVITYDGKLHIAMKNDKMAIDSKVDCKELLENVYENIKLLDQEIERENSHRKQFINSYDKI